jgi:hypothetical protein
MDEFNVVVIIAVVAIVNIIVHVRSSIDVSDAIETFENIR